MARSLQFIDSQQSAFFATVRKRVEAYFNAHSLSKKANGTMWAKAVMMLTAFFGLYGLTLFQGNGSWLGIGLAIGLGISSALVGFNVSHDAIHGAFSSHRNTNHFLGFSFYLIGANPYVWNISHHMAHHTYTNIAGYDEDIEIAPGLIRLSPQEKVRRFHRYQHYYAFVLYGLASLAWVFRKDYVKFFKAPTTHPRIEYFHLFFYKGVYYFLFLGLPFLLLPLAYRQQRWEGARPGAWKAVSV